MRHDQVWNWCFYGKHPAARDYLTIGEHAIMAQAFIDWVQGGYLPLIGKKEKPGVSKSWRFWSRTPVKGQLVCGLVRSSCDAIGRTYPLLIIGAGPLQGWEKNWEVLPFVCEKVWQQLEHISTRQYDTLERLKQDINLLKPPDNQWTELRDSKTYGDVSAVANHLITPGIDQEVKEKVAKLTEGKEIFMALKPQSSENLFLLTANWHKYIKRHCTILPNALFMGGSMQQSFLAVFLRPLKPDDFTLLWDLPALRLSEN